MFRLRLDVGERASAPGMCMEFGKVRDSLALFVLAIAPVLSITIQPANWTFVPGEPPSYYEATSVPN